jgi:hypothetical protein
MSAKRQAGGGALAEMRFGNCGRFPTRLDSKRKPALRRHVAQKARLVARTLYEDLYRVWFSAMTYVLLDTLRRVALRRTQFADAAVATIRLKLLKLGAQVRITVRRIHFALASGSPNKDEFAIVHRYLRRAFGSA